MIAKFVYESLMPKIKWDWTFKNEKIIDIFKYRGIPVKIVRVENDPSKYYFIPSLGEHIAPMGYYNLKKTIELGKRHIDLYLYLYKIKESMQIPLKNDKNKIITQKYPLENPNYLGDCANDNKKTKNKKNKKIVKESLNQNFIKR